MEREKKTQKEVFIDRLPEPEVWVKNIIQDSELHRALIHRTFDVIAPLWTSRIKDPLFREEFEKVARQKHVDGLMPSQTEGDITESGEFTTRGLKRIGWKFTEASNLASNYNNEYRTLINSFRNHTIDRGITIPSTEGVSSFPSESTLFDYSTSGED
jgi:hypothetical protein